MILDNLNTSLTDYGIMGGKLGRALAWLKSADLKTLRPGEVIEIDGKSIFAKVCEAETVPAEPVPMESHLRHVDIQAVVEGTEVMYWAPAAALTRVRAPYNHATDMIYYENIEGMLEMKLRSGDFAVFFPSDGHKGQCMDGKPGRAKKILVKIAVQ